MEDKTEKLMKEFEQEHEIYVGVSDKLTFWIIAARIKKTAEKGTHHLHFGRRYISGPTMEGNVLVLPDPENSDAAFAQTWEPMHTVDDFVVQALFHILSDQEAEAADTGAGCGAGCS